MSSCKHEWSYTHSNGFKTCKVCKKFTACTIEEALNNYEKGNVKVNDFLNLYFHNNKAICKCGSKQVYYLQLSMLDKKKYQCTKCSSYLPLKFKHLKYDDVPISPNDDEYKNASFERKGKGSFNQHKIFSLGLETEANLKKLIAKYTLQMFKHYVFFEKDKDYLEEVLTSETLIDKELISEFIIWFEPYVYNYTKGKNIQIKYNDKKLELVSIKHFKINIENKKWDISYDLETRTPEKPNPEPAELFKNIFTAMLNSEEK